MYLISVVGELTSRTMAKRLGTLANRPKMLAKRIVGETTVIQKNTLLSNATPIRVYKMKSADCTQAVLDCRLSTD